MLNNIKNYKKQSEKFKCKKSNKAKSGIDIL